MRFSEWRQAFWEARQNPLIFFAVAFAVGISVNFLSSWLEGRAWAEWVFGLGVPLALLVVILSPWFERIRQRVLRYPEAVPVILAKAGPCKGLVVIASLREGSSSARAAVEYHAETLQRVWILHSEASEAEAKALQAFCAALPRLTLGQVTLLGLTNEKLKSDPEATRELIEERVYGDLRDLRPDDVILDVTGGSKAASVGASLAGLPRGRRLELVQGRSHDERGRATEAGDPLEIRMDYKLKPLRRR